MKHLKKYNESVNEFTFFDIVDILQDIIDDGYDIVIYSATGHSYRPEDIDRGVNGINTGNTFNFHRYPNESKKSFKIQIGFHITKTATNMSLKYIGLVDFLDEMKLPIARFEDAGFYLSHMEPEVDGESDTYRCYGVDYAFESH